MKKKSDSSTGTTDEATPNAQGLDRRAGADAVDIPKSEDTLESLQAERAEFRDKFLRAQAECANISKRLHQQHAADRRLAGMDLARSLLPVLDSLERTLASLDESAGGEPLRQGVQLIADEFLKAFAEHGIVPILSIGQPFDPLLHEAMMQDHATDLPPGMVSQELQRGYKMHDRVLRPSKVMVSAERNDTAPDEASGGGPADRTGATDSQGSDSMPAQPREK
jgi:molecular chaperone GrpE